MPKTTVPLACVICGTEFVPSKHMQTRAKYCSRRCNDQARRERDPERKRERDRESYARHRAARVARSRAWAEANPERQREHLRRYHLKRKFGVTVEQYDAMMDAQNGRCAICGTDDPSPWQYLCVDHDHGSGAIRGLLCQKCNTCIGQGGDDPAVLRKAADYLEGFGA